MNERVASAFPPPGPHAVPGGRVRGYIPTLDGWRAVAILWVILYHDGRQLFFPSGALPSRALYRVAQAGHLGVDIFFAISGFLICSRLLDERQRRGRIDLKAFYLRRFFRIMPPYYAFLAVVGLLGLAGRIELGRLEYLSCLTFWRNYCPDVDGLTTIHFWSLSVEEHFYLLWPCLLVLLATPRRAAWAALGLAILVRAWRTIDLRGGLGVRYLGLADVPVFQRTDACLDGLLLGCLLALIVSSEAGRARLARLLHPAVWWGMLAAFAALGVYLVQFPGSGHLIAALVPLLVVGTCLHPRSVAGRVLEWGPLRWVGRLSYSLYLWQVFFASLAVVPWPESGPGPGLDGMPWPLRFPINWAAALACALASYHLVERPMIEAGRRLASRHKARAAPAHDAVPLPRPDGVAAFD